MTTKQVQLQNANEDVLHVETEGSLVLVTGGNLGEVEPGAQVNEIETIKVNGTALTPDANKAVDITIASQAEYTIAKKATAESGYIATYELKKDGTKVGDSINIPKDFLVKSASVKICAEAGVPSCTPALAVGDPYMDFVINTKDGSGSDEHLYINCKSFVDVYTAGTGLSLSGHEFSVDNTVVAFQTDLPTAISDLTDDTATTPVAKASTLDGLTATVTELNYVDGVTSAIQTQIDGKVAKNAAITGASKCKITYDSKGLVTAGADLEASDIPSLSLSKISDVSATATEVNYLSGVTSNVQNQIDGKQATIDSSHKLSADLIAAGETNAVVSITEKAAFAAKQDALSSSNKLNADYIQAGSTNAVVTITEKAAFAAKQDAIDASHKLDADLIDDSTATHKFVSASEKSTWNGKQDAISASNKLSADYIQAGSTNAVITKTEKSTYDGYASTIAAKANAADVYTKTQVDNLLLKYVELEG